MVKYIPSFMKVQWLRRKPLQRIESLGIVVGSQRRSINKLIPLLNGVEIEYMKKESYDFFIYSLSLKLVLEVDQLRKI